MTIEVFNFDAKKRIFFLEPSQKWRDVGLKLLYYLLICIIQYEKTLNGDGLYIFRRTKRVDLC